MLAAGAMPSCSGVGIESGITGAEEEGPYNAGAGVGSSGPLARIIGRGVTDCCVRTTLEDAGAGPVCAGRAVHDPGGATIGAARYEAMG